MISVNDPGVPPGTFSDRFVARVESTMNGTIREAVFVSEHLDAGDIQGALRSLTQMQLNIEHVISGIGRRLKGVKS